MTDEAELGPQGQQGGDVVPRPTPVSWTLGPVETDRAVNGEKIIMVRFNLVTGPVFIFLPAGGAKLLGEQLIENATGLTVAKEMPT